MKRWLAVLASVVLAVITAGCDNSHYTEYGGEITTLDAAGMVSMVEAEHSKAAAEELRKEQQESAKVAGIENAGKVFDRQGMMMQLPSQVRTIVSCGPAATEILVGLGLSDRIIAADIYSSDVKGIDPDLCNIDMMKPDVQAIAELSPDMAVIPEISLIHDNNLIDELEKRGIFTAFIPLSNSIESIKMDIEFLAALTGTTDAGLALIADMNTEILEISEIISSVISRPSVYLEINSAPDIYAAGDNTFISGIIGIAGGWNYYSGQAGYLPLTDADILGDGVNPPIDPDYIISAVSYEGYSIDEIKSRPGWDKLQAVQEGKVYSISPNSVLRPSQHITEAIREIAVILYPEAFETA